MSLGKTIMLAETKSLLHARVDQLTELDAVLLVIGQRLEEDDAPQARVQVMRRNAYAFEALGLLHIALGFATREGME